MGVSESKPHLDDKGDHLQEDDPGKIKEEVDSAHHTPIVNRRLIMLQDPRSPTDGVSRTPIVVPKPGAAEDSFEDPRSPTIKIARTPVPDTDPRSPTEGVARTPCPFTYPDPRSPTVNVARTPTSTETQQDKFVMSSDEVNQNVEETTEETKDNSSGNNSNDTERLILEGTAEPEEPSAASKKSSGSSTKKSKKPSSLRQSLKTKLQGSQAAPSRSPLANRNLHKDSAVHVHSERGVITYEKTTESRRRSSSGTPTRLIGKYEPVLDKENF